MNGNQWEPVTAENCKLVLGPFYHGTKAELSAGDLLSPGHPSNYEKSRALKHVYFSAILEPAIWGAELAMHFAKSDGRGHIYVVEPLGSFEDDPNLTNKRFHGNPTRSYRTREPIRIIGVVDDWQGHTKAAIQGMVDSIMELRRQGLAVIED